MKFSAMADAPFFVLLDIPSQVQRLLKGCNILDLSKPLRFHDTFSDITDGKVYGHFVTSTIGSGHRISFTLTILMEHPFLNLVELPSGLSSFL